MPKNMGGTFSCAYLICRAADSIADTDLISVDKRIKIIHDYPKMVETNDEGLLQEFKKAIPEKNNLHENERVLLEHIDIVLKLSKSYPPYIKKLL